MITFKANWNGPGAVAELKAASWQAIQRMIVFYWTALQNALNVSNPRPYVTPSKPGEPPRKRTGFLARQVLYDLDQARMTGRVGVTRNARYGVWLELGTRRMKPRPWLLATLKKILPQLEAISKTK